jgi:CheY-like chemotaxis protein
MAESAMERLLSILLVDDDPVDLAMLSAELTKQGCSVLKAQSGEAALKVLAENPPDICISDWSMPGMEGIELCRRARLILNSRPFYFLLLTANADKQLHLEAIKAGVDDVAEKVWDPAVLEARLLVAKRSLNLQSKVAKGN